MGIYRRGWREGREGGVNGGGMAGVGKEGEWKASKKHIHYSSSPEAVTLCTSCAGLSGTWKLLLHDIHHLTSRSRIKGSGQAKK